MGRRRSGFSTPAVEAASAHVLADVKDKCGIDLASTAAAGTSAP